MWFLKSCVNTYILLKLSQNIKFKPIRNNFCLNRKFKSNLGKSIDYSRVMELKPNQNNISDVFTELNQCSAEARNNLLGFFEVLIEIDQRLQAESLVKSKNLSNNES